MNKILFYIALALACFTSCNESSQKESVDSDTLQTDSLPNVDPDTANFSRAPRTVQQIQHLYAAARSLTNQNKLDTTSFTYNCHGEKRGRVTYYSQAGALRLIVHEYNEYDHYEATDEYYIANDSLYFAYLHGKAWSFESGAPEATRNDITERRIYVAQDQLIHCLEKKYSTRSSDTDPGNNQTIENNEVECSTPQQVIGPLRVLLKYNGAPTAGCLE